jgi:hypothetical protein
MSAGHSARRGYLMSIHTPPTAHEVTGGEHVTMILAFAILVMVIALGTNEIVAGALARLLTGLWSDVARFVLHILSGGKV